MSPCKKILFLSGTRADWGKMCPLIKKIKFSRNLEYYIFVCGMHLLKSYGNTYLEILKDGFDRLHIAKPFLGSQMDLALSHTIKELSSFVKNFQPDMIVVHGDRLEALAGAITGAFNNITVAHIEGGERSGTIDESIRHSISKLAHLHFVANKEAKTRLIQLGEKKESIFIIGSPDIDIMLSSSLPTLQEVCNHYYQIQPIIKDYALFIYHPVTTELSSQKQHLDEIFNALKHSRQNFICIYPNNDPGSKPIIQRLKALKGPNFVCFRSIKFQAFLTLLKHTNFILGNSSAGIREAPIYGIPTINIGSRQKNRHNPSHTILCCKENTEEILLAIEKAIFLKRHTKIKKISHFGEGNSAERFLKIIQKDSLWSLNLQKNFIDLL